MLLERRGQFFTSAGRSSKYKVHWVSCCRISLCGYGSRIVSALALAGATFAVRKCTLTLLGVIAKPILELPKEHHCHITTSSKAISIPMFYKRPCPSTIYQSSLQLTLGEA